MDELERMEELEHLRRLRGLSQRDLARKSGVSPTTVYELETGRRKANPSTLRRLAAALDVDVAHLLGEEYPKAHTLPLENWSRSFPGEGFPGVVKATPTEELLHAMKRNLGNLPAQEIEDLRQDRERAMAAAMARQKVFAHARIVGLELRTRGVEPPEGFLPDYRRWLEFMDSE